MKAKHINEYTSWCGLFLYLYLSRH